MFNLRRCSTGALNSPYLTQIVEYSEEKRLEKSTSARFPRKIISISSVRGARLPNNPHLLYYLLHVRIAAWPGAKTCIMKPKQAGCGTENSVCENRNQNRTFSRCEAPARLDGTCNVITTSKQETWQTELNLRQCTGPDDERTRDVTNRAEPQTTHWAWWRANERRDKQSWTSDNALSLMTSERETWQTELNLRQRTGPDDERTRDVTNRAEPQTTHWPDDERTRDVTNRA